MNIRRVTDWLKHLSVFAVFQAMIQLTGLFTGLILVRFLSREEYAFYTIAFSMQSTFSILANLGVGSAVMAIASRILQDKKELGRLMYTGFFYRRKLAFYATLLVAPIMAWLLLKNGASALYATLLVLIVLADLHFNLAVEYYLVILRLFKQVIIVQKIELKTRLLRLLMIMSGYFVYLNALIGILTTFGSSVIRHMKLSKELSREIAIEGPLNESYQKEIVETLKRLAPNSIFYTIQGQLTIWLISIFGNTSGVAEIGALGRFAIIFGFIGELTTNYIVPGFARIHQRVVFFRRFCQVVSIFIFWSGCALSISYLYPEKILWILGEKYTHLQHELTLILFSSILHSFGGMLWSIMLGKAWVKHVWINIPAILFLQLAYVCYFDITSLNGAIWIGIIAAIPGIIIPLFSLPGGLKTLDDDGSNA